MRFLTSSPAVFRSVWRWLSRWPGFLSNASRHRRHDFSTGIRLLSSSLNFPRTDALLSAIARSCSSCTTPRRGFKKSPISALLISSLGKSLGCGCTARATSGVPVPSGSRHRSYSNNYSTIGPPLHPRRPSSHPTADGASRRSESTKSSAATRLSFTLLKCVLHYATSALTFFGTMPVPRLCRLHEDDL